MHRAKLFYETLFPGKFHKVTFKFMLLWAIFDSYSMMINSKDFLPLTKFDLYL